jgi:hypothetical protein
MHRREPQRRFAGSSVSSSSHTDPGVRRSSLRGRVVSVGVQTLRLVARELLAALARSRSASTSSRRTRKARPTRSAGSTPRSIQLRIVCAVTWYSSATWGTVRSCRSRTKVCCPAVSTGRLSSLARFRTAARVLSTVRRSGRSPAQAARSARLARPTAGARPRAPGGLRRRRLRSGAPHLAPHELAERHAHRGRSQAGAVGSPDLVTDLHSRHPIAWHFGRSSDALGSFAPSSSHWPTPTVALACVAAGRSQPPGSQAPTRARRTLKRYPRAVPYGGSGQQMLLGD